MARKGTLHRDISPPPLRKSSTALQASAAQHDRPGSPGHDTDGDGVPPVLGKSDLAAVEAGEVEIRDHLQFFLQNLSAASRPSNSPRIGFDAWEDLYRRNQHSHGIHFVVHQHDHPVSGVHYDLRLQVSATSSISFAVPYGLPGNPNSQRPNRMAIETRVHNLWNHLVESASHATGSLLIWDTGEYEVLPRHERQQKTTEDELSDPEADSQRGKLSQSELLFRAFRSRHIHLRLHGSKVPRGYTIALRLPSAHHVKTQPKKPARKRRRRTPTKHVVSPGMTTDSESDSPTIGSPLTSTIDSEAEEEDLAAALASEDDEDATIRANNAYTGATNTIGSVHQRHWFLTLDRSYSGFRKARTGPDAGRWVGPWEAFYVRGRDIERSVITGRNADELMDDEHVEKFVGRKMWRPILE